MSPYESSIVGHKTNESEIRVLYRSARKDERSRTCDESRGRGV